jgi:hypothetical protein
MRAASGASGGSTKPAFQSQEDHVQHVIEVLKHVGALHPENAKSFPFRESRASRILSLHRALMFDHIRPRSNCLVIATVPKYSYVSFGELKKSCTPLRGIAAAQDCLLRFTHTCCTKR